MLTSFSSCMYGLHASFEDLCCCSWRPVEFLLIFEPPCFAPVLQKSSFTSGMLLESNNNPRPRPLSPNQTAKPQQALATLRPA